MKKPCRKCSPNFNSRPLFNFLTLFFFWTACHPYVTRLHSSVIRMSLVCTRMSSVCHSYVLVCHPYVTRMSSVCHSHVIVCHSYVIHMSLACTRMSSVCHSYVLVCHSSLVLPWTPLTALVSKSIERKDSRKYIKILKKYLLEFWIA